MRSFIPAQWLVKSFAFTAMVVLFSFTALAQPDPGVITPDQVVLYLTPVIVFGATEAVKWILPKVSGFVIDTLAWDYWLCLYHS